MFAGRQGVMGSQSPMVTDWNNCMKTFMRVQMDEAVAGRRQIRLSCFDHRGFLAIKNFSQS